MALELCSGEGGHGTTFKTAFTCMIKRKMSCSLVISVLWSLSSPTELTAVLITPDLTQGDNIGWRSGSLSDPGQAGLHKHLKVDRHC